MTRGIPEGRLDDGVALVALRGFVVLAPHGPLVGVFEDCDAVADSYGQLTAHMAGSGRQPRARTTEVLIAATAHVHQAVQHTRNADDFRQLESFLVVVRA